MSDQQSNDSSQKNHAPTETRKRKAREKGQIAQSKEVFHFFVLMTCLIVLKFLGTMFTRYFNNVSRGYFDIIGQVKSDQITSFLLTYTRYMFIAMFIGLVLLIIPIAWAGAVQTQWHITFENLKPKLEKISWSRGIKKIFSMENSINFIKDFIKILIVGGVIYFIICYELSSLILWPLRNPFHIADGIQHLVGKILFSVLCVMAVIAVSDFAFQWFRQYFKLHMSHQELKDEMKEQEGHPETKSKRLSQRRSMHENMASVKHVSTASVIITNPTHYAVAMTWRTGMHAPIVISKGTDEIALKIQQIGRHYGIIIMQQPALARQIYRDVAIGKEIHEKHYAAVAEVMQYVMKARPHLVK